MTAPLDYIQSTFQARLLRGDNTVNSYLSGGGPFMKVYTHAYVARQQEIIAEQFPALLALLGDDQFADATVRYIRANPPTKRSARWVGEHLADWLRQDATYSALPMIADMATFEWALAHAFDAPDDNTLAMGDLASVPPEAWPMLMFDFHPAVRIVDLRYDVAPFQRAVVSEQEPEGAPDPFDTPTAHVIWRDAESLIVHYRPLDSGEEIALKTAIEGTTFTVICECLTEVDEENAAGLAASYLRNWVETGLLSNIEAEGISWS